MKWKLYASKKSYLSDRLEHRVKSRLDPFSRIFDVRRARERPLIVVCQVDLSALRRGKKKTCLNCGESRQLKFTARTNLQQRRCEGEEISLQRMKKNVNDDDDDVGCVGVKQHKQATRERDDKKRENILC